MKYYILPLLALFLACSNSDESENSSNNFNHQEKLISSMNVSSVDCSEGEMPNEFLRGYRLDVYYTDNIVTGSDAYDCDFSCNVFLGCSSEISWWNQYISIGMSSYNEFPLTNQDQDAVLSYVNNNIISRIPNDGLGLYHYYTWEEGKLMNVTTYLDGNILMWSFDFTYSDYTNLTRLFPPAPWGGAGFMFPSGPLALMGAAGNITLKLPSSIFKKRWDESTGVLESTTTTNFIYQFDNEGYVTSFETISPNGFKYTTTIEYQ